MAKVQKLAQQFALLAAVAALPNQLCAHEATTAPLTEAEIRARTDALLVQMTPEEKALQLQLQSNLIIPGVVVKPEQWAERGTGAFLMISSVEDTNRFQHIAMEKSRLKIPVLFAFDVIHGLTTIFPVPIAMAASWDVALVEKSQAIAASEARSVGIAWTFAPMLDIARDARWGRMVEGAGEDPYLGTVMGVAQIRGFQGMAIGAPGHVIAGPKHFAGYGAAVGGRDYDEVNLSDSELRNVYLPPFKAAIDIGAGNVMSAYMPLNGIPAAANHWLLTDVLRNEWGFKGWVVSDSSAVKSLKTHGLTIDNQDSAARAMNAGLDMELTFANAAFNDLPKAVAEGQVSGARVDESVRRVLEAKLRLGLFEHPYADEAKAAQNVGAPAHLAAAQTAAERSAVLLRNSGGLLPLDRVRIHSVAVLGPLADSGRDAVGPWVFKENHPIMQSILAGIREKLGSQVQVTYAPGVAMPPRANPSPISIMENVQRPAPANDDAGIAEAVKQARAADVAILVLGEGEDMIGELASRSSLDLPGRQQDLLDAVVATGKPVVVLLMNGRPLDLKETKAPAILDIWYPGSRGGAAAANLLFGDATPGGKLPFTWPRDGGQLPLFYAHLTTHAPKDAGKRYWNETNDPVWPFGFGLSYSSFAYAHLAVDQASIAPGGQVKVSVDVRNTGARFADEVAQLYVHQRSGTAARPVRELKGFQRIALKPGETRRLSFILGPEEMRYWNSEIRDWTIDNTTFDVAVGGDSTAPFGASFAVSKSR